MPKRNDSEMKFAPESMALSQRLSAVRRENKVEPDALFVVQWPDVVRLRRFPE